MTHELSSSSTEAQEIKYVDVLPIKSKNRYECVYAKFIDWCKSKNIKTYNENCLLAYFQTFSSAKSLSPTYSMLKSCLMIHNNIDISKFSRLIFYLKKKSKNRKPNKSRVLTNEHIQKFIKEAPDSTYLLMKVVLIMGISGGCHREELCKMSIDDIEFKTNVVFVSIPIRKTDSQRFAIIDPTWISILIKYTELRPNTTKRFFLTYREGKCVNSPVGLNTFGKIPIKIAEFLNLDKPEEYTGHCFRSSANLLANQGSASFKRLKGCETTTLELPHHEVEEETTKTYTSTIDLPGVSILISNCANCPINIYGKYNNSDNVT